MEECSAYGSDGSERDTKRYSQIKPGAKMYLAVFLILISACSVALSGKIDLPIIESDFGTIKNTEPVTQTFELRNSGQGLLTIKNLSTSCSCTTAKVSKEILEPGELSDLSITFDPTAHNGATGQFMRLIFIESDDPETPRAVFTMHITVVE